MEDKSEVLKYLQSLQQELRDIEKQVFEICWYMRGGISLTEAWSLSFDQRTTVMEIINSNIERTKSSGLALL
tara:strand:+ start:319 stop:534 length:216 start_codon:yes stop_codon:yes gene_type:complete